MTENNVVSLKSPEEIADPLTDLLRTGARKLLSQAIEAEVEALLASHSDVRDTAGNRAVVRNGYLPARQVQTGIGSVEVQLPRVRDRSGSGITFHSSLIPPYLRRSKSIEELLPVLYLKGISTGDFSEALGALLGKDCSGVSAATIGRLKSTWADELEAWQQRDLSCKRYVYFWVDGIYFQVRGEDKLCTLVILGADDTGKKEVVAIEDGYRESKQSWKEVLLDLRKRGLNTAPELAIGDGALGFWSALDEVYGTTKKQRCWVHKMANVLNKLPKSLQKKAKSLLHEIWLSPDKCEAEKAFEHFIACYEDKYPKATGCLAKDKAELLAFYDFPAKHWQHIRSTNAIESVFATVRIRTTKTRGCLSRQTTMMMVFKLMQSASKRWIRLSGSHHCAEIIQGVNFKDGVAITKINANTKIIRDAA
jgi:transposase-like protein